ncbi:MAG: hypothetical protein ACI845_000922 [Gammaproteobacteria bacterium]|jgi:hypothetical protein
MNAGSRGEILEEIQSHANEIDDNPKSLIEHFGSPEELAQQYLEGEIPKTQISSKFATVGRRFFITIGISVTAIVLISFFTIKMMNKDDFNYADVNSTEIQKNQTEWKTANWPDSNQIYIEQSRVVFYWHDEKTISWKCEGSANDSVDSATKLKLRHASCFIYLPQIKTPTISISQSSVVMVKPGNSVEIDMNQSSLRIAQNGAQYGYVLNTSQSDIDDFNSVKESPVQISIQANESSVSNYQF